MQFSNYEQMIEFTESMHGFLSRDCIIKLEEVLIKMSPDNVDSDIFKTKNNLFYNMLKEYSDILLSELNEKLRPYIQSLYFQQVANFSNVLSKSKIAGLQIMNPFDCIGCAGLGPSFSCAVCENSLGFNTCGDCDGEGLTVCAECDGFWEEHEECNDCGGEGQQDCYNCDGDGRKDCNDCDGEGELECGECDGGGESVCKECDGEGDLECEECDGEGQIICEDCEGGEEVDCGECDGTGVVEDDEGEEENCSECEGNGVVDCDNCEGGYSEECSTCKATGKINCEGDCDGDGVVMCSNCDGGGYEECDSCDTEGDFECGDCYGEGLEECEECYGNGTVECSECDEGHESCNECNSRGVIRCNSCVGVGKGICGFQHPIRVKPDKKFIENKDELMLYSLEVDAKNPLLIATQMQFRADDYHISLFPKSNSSWRLYLVYNDWIITLLTFHITPSKIIKKQPLISSNYTQIKTYKSNNISLSKILKKSSNIEWVHYIYLKSGHAFMNWKKMPWDVKS